MANDVDISIGANSSQATSAIQQVNNALGQLGNGAQQQSGMLGQLGSAFGGVVSWMGQFINNALTIATGVGLYNAFDTMIAKAKEFGDAMFELNNTMERTQTSWEFLFGTGANAKSQQMAQQLADWTKKESYFFPFTRQDMLGAINAAGMATTDPNMIMKYLPEVADIASVRTNFAGQPVTLQQAMYALAMANEGMSRMLKYDLKITPEDLKKYGWNEKGHDFNNLLQALNKYEKAHHLVGASKYIATHTWFGEMSSFEDRIQNFQLAMGQGLFKGLEQDLNDFTAWWDAHQKDLDAFADMMGNKIANGLHAVGDAAKDFIAGISGGSGLASQSQQIVDAAKVWEELFLKGDITSDAYNRLAKGETIQQMLRRHEITRQQAAEMRDLYQQQQAAMQHTTSTSSTSNLGFFGQVGGILRGLGSISLSGIGAFFATFSQMHVGDALTHMLDSIRQLAQDPNLQHMATIIGGIAGLVVGEGLHILADTIGSLAQFGKWFVDQGPLFNGVLIALAATIATKLVVGFTQWAIQAGLAAAATIASKVAGMADWVVSVASAIATLAINFGLWAANAASAAAATVASKVVGFATWVADTAAAIPALVVGFGEWAAGAWAAAAGTIAATWPILLIIAAIALLVVGIVLLVQHWDQLSKAMTDFAVNVVTKADQAWNNLLQSVIRIGVSIATAFHDHVIQPITDAWTHLIAIATDWGKHLIDNIINGIMSALGSLKNAAGQVGTTIHNVLGHSVPKEGPLADEMQWGGHLVDNLATGMIQGIPRVAAATRQVAGAIHDGVMLAPGTVGSGYNTAYSTAYGNVTNNVTLNAVGEARVAQIAQAVVKAAMDDAAYLANFTPGGYAVFGAR